MHHTLEIPEILLDIFGRCHYPDTGAETASSDLPALARTCRAFKEPALDLLWKNLPDPSPIVRCLPEASHYSQISPEKENKRYSFCRILTQTEDRLNWKSVKTFLNLPIASPLFPNLLHLHVVSGGRLAEVKPLLYMPFPSLTSLTIDAMKEKNLTIFRHPIELFSRFSPDIRKLSFSLKPDTMFSNFFTGRIFRWQNLQTVSCIKVALDADALVHLSSIPALTELTCTVSAALADQVTPSYSPLLFSNVHSLTFYSDLLKSISRLLSRTRLPAVRIFAAIIASRPSKMDLSSFLSTLYMSDIADTVELHMNQVGSLENIDVTQDRRSILALKDLQPFIALSKLRLFSINIEWNVDHSHSDLLTVTLAWPRLELLHINHDWARNMPGGITSDGLLQFLQQCPSLHFMSLATDSRRPTEDPVFSEPHCDKYTINILDSTLEQESVKAITAFLTRIAYNASWSSSTYHTNWLGTFFWIQVEMHLANNIRERSGLPSGSTL
ncbi:hypothetical protein L210DRAFT_3654651 [Boletus edulis BED1]|uniref:F-box domain-containing protein n=1 Tax=Boletus edulis BED1 TaxID=1328754 RepID=A0AAD4BCU0_BOLED|nr:hypothetical protein L210DRAFT_3654651 [Boletus edulis BED1]